MKIAMFTDALLEIPGGIGSSISAAKKSLEAAGHEVLVFAPGWHEEKDPQIIVVPALKLFRPGGAPWARRPSKVAAWIREKHPEIADFDIFHAHYEGPLSLAAVRLAREMQKPLVQSLHGREDQALAHNIPVLLQKPVASLLAMLHAKSLKNIGIKTDKKLVFDPKLAPNKERAKMWKIITGQGGAAELVIAPSEHFAEKLKKMGLKTPITVLPNGIDDDIVPLKPQLRVLKPSETLKILWNSRLSKEKRFLPFLNALKIAGEAGLKYELVAFGGGNDFRRARKYVRQHGLKVKLMGPAGRPHILRESIHCHLAVTASYDFDVHSLILVEAEACGTPLFICDPDMVASLPAGSFILSKTPAPEDMAAALMELYAHPERVAMMSSKMLARRQEVYQSARMAELIKIYQGLLRK